MKVFAIIIVIVLLGVAALLLLSPKAPKDVQSLEVGDGAENQDQNQTQEEGTMEGKVELTEFSFVGYGPGKSHTGLFEKYEVKDVVINSEGIPTRGTLVIQADSVKTDTAMLDTHLKEKAEFFQVDRYPTIEFALTNVTETSPGLYQVRGNLTMKEVSRPVAFTVNGNPDKTFSSEFKLKMSDFGFSAPGIVDDEVLIKFAGKIN